MVESEESEYWREKHRNQSGCRLRTSKPRKGAEICTGQAVLQPMHGKSDRLLEPILFQSGYLTIEKQFRVGAAIMYRLCFPNLETRYSFNDYILSQLLQQEDTKVTFQSAIYTALENADVPAFEQALRCLFAAIPNNNHTRNNIASFEGYYASVIYAGLASLGLDIAAEDVTSTGRIDLTVKLNGHIYIMEFKVDGPNAALAQIKEKNYHAKYLNEDGDIYLIGIDFDSTSRSVAGVEWERV